MFLFLSVWLSKKSCTLRELQSLISTLQFACRVVVPGRAFLQRMINLTREVIEPHHRIILNSAFRQDVAMWLVFLEQWNGTNIFLDIVPTNLPEHEFSTDASGSIGYGAFFNNFWFQGKWSSQFHGHTEQQSIAWKELFPVYLACSVWGNLWSGKRIILWCDNISVTQILNSKSSKVTVMLWAAFTLAFFGFLRVSEFTYSNAQSFLAVNDIAFIPSITTPDSIQVHIKQSKTDPFRRGTTLAIAKSHS